jgi:hypothetical protein
VGGSTINGNALGLGSGGWGDGDGSNVDVSVGGGVAEGVGVVVLDSGVLRVSPDAGASGKVAGVWVIPVVGVAKGEISPCWYAGTVSAAKARGRGSCQRQISTSPRSAKATGVFQHKPRHGLWSFCRGGRVWVIAAGILSGPAPSLQIL